VYTEAEGGKKGLEREVKGQQERIDRPSRKPLGVNLRHLCPCGSTLERSGRSGKLVCPLDNTVSKGEDLLVLLAEAPLRF